jgi:exopolysaccharide biosynthesis polyprenyl glycosylphosphotransferase
LEFIEQFLEYLQIPSGIVWRGAELEALLMPQVLLLVAILWPVFFISFSVYDGQRSSTLMAELKNIIIATTAATLALAGILFFSYRETSRVLLLIFFFLDLAILSGSRIIWWVYRYNTKKHTKQRQKQVLIIGAGEVGNQLRDSILSDFNNNLTVVGFLDDDTNKQTAHPDNILGCTDTVREVVKRFNVDDVVLALPRRAHERVNHLVTVLHNLPVRVWVIPDYFSLSLHKAKMLEYAGIPMLDLRAPALNDQQRMIKRIFDIAVTVVSLLILFPVMLLIALAIKLDTPGPIFFKQKRVGENGRLFNMIKFRTMVEDADAKFKNMLQLNSEGKLVYKRQDDPRVTKVGKYLRQTSLDEFPQFINVLKGDMSLVGPRPEIPYLVERYEPWQRTRFAVPQGITGWWQIHGRSDKPMHLHTDEDIYYVQHYSFLFDIKILLKTPAAVLGRKGAF